MPFARLSVILVDIYTTYIWILVSLLVSYRETSLPTPMADRRTDVIRLGTGRARSFVVGVGRGDSSHQCAPFLRSAEACAPIYELGLLFLANICNTNASQKHITFNDAA